MKIQERQNLVLDKQLSAAVKKTSNDVSAEKDNPKASTGKYGFPMLKVDWKNIRKHCRIYDCSFEELCYELLLRKIVTEETLTNEGRVTELASLRNLQSGVGDRRVMCKHRGALMVAMDPYGR